MLSVVRVTKTTDVCEAGERQKYDGAGQFHGIERVDVKLAGIRARVRKYIPEGTMLSEELMADRREESARDGGPEPQLR
jgi:hypothetical protein